LTHGKYDFDGEDTGAYVSVQGNTDDEEAFVWGSAAISKGDVKALKVGGKKIIGTDAGRIMVAPRYNFETSSAKVVLGFEKDDTNAYLTVSEDDKDLLVEQTIDDANSATLKLGTSGFIAATLTNESDLGSTKLTLTTDEIDVEIKSDGWVAGMSCDKNLVNASPEIRFGKSHTFSI
jgi:flagellar basal body rod protein FlgF